MLFLRKSDETIWKSPLSKRTPPLPLSTKPPTSGQFFCDPLFFQISKMRTPPSNFRGGDPLK